MTTIGSTRDMLSIATMAASHAPAADPADDLALIAAHRAGNARASRALGVLVLDVSERVAARFKQLSLTDKHELIATAATLAMRKLHLYRGDSRLSTWLFSLALNAARMFLRGSGYKRVRRMLGRTGDETYEFLDVDHAPGGDPESRYVEAERAALLRRAVEDFRRTARSEDARALTLVYHDGLGLVDAAREIGITEPALRTRMARTRTSLRERIELLLAQKKTEPESEPD